MSELFHVQQAAVSEKPENMCACGQAPKRSGQRNCHDCHALVNRIYRVRLRNKREIEHALAVREMLEHAWTQERGHRRRRRS